MSTETVAAAAAAQPPAPRLIFIVPYRDRARQKEFFMHHMEYVLKDYAPDSYKIYFAHQCDGREFNRGAMKNIGFLAMRDMYPADYKNITFVFNDVDTMPYSPNHLQYETAAGTIKHFYGFNYTLGGIVSIKGADYERAGGFPNLWAWGMEDNALQQRVLSAGMKIDRTQFYQINSPEILHFRDGITRTVNRTDFDIYMSKVPEGINTIRDLKYEIEGECIQVRGFSTGREENKATKREFDLRAGNKPFGSDPYGEKSVAKNMGLGVFKGGVQRKVQQPVEVLDGKPRLMMWGGARRGAGGRKK
jgi:hypothetical protein